MQKAWLPALLVGVMAVFCVLLVLAAQRMSEAGPDPEAVAAAAHPGYRIYLQARCAQCHGEKLEGTTLAPSLLELHADWDRDRLAHYLVRPDSFIAADPRLAAQRSEYPRVMMPSYPQIPRAQRELLAGFLLAPHSMGGP